MPKILVVAETKNGELKKPTLELLSLAKSMNLQTESVLIGKEVSSQADLLADLQHLKEHQPGSRCGWTIWSNPGLDHIF